MSISEIKDRPWNFLTRELRSYRACQTRFLDIGVHYPYYLFREIKYFVAESSNNKQQNRHWPI